jgi:chromosome segregation ATPase
MQNVEERLAAALRERIDARAAHAANTMAWESKSAQLRAALTAAAKVPALKLDLAAARREVAADRQAAANARAALVAAAAALEHALSERDEAARKAHEAEIKIQLLAAAAEAERTRLLAANEHLTSQLADAKREVGHLEQAKLLAKGTIEDLRRQFTATKSMERDLEADVQQLQADKARGLGEISQLKRRLQQLEARASEDATELQRQQAETSEVRADRSRLRLELEHHFVTSNKLASHVIAMSQGALSSAHTFMDASYICMCKL